MNLLPPARRRSTEDNLIPLINIVFLLLIFFMVAGQMRNNIPLLSLPESSKGKTTNADSLQIAINSHKEWFINGRAVVEEELGQYLNNSVQTVNLLVDRQLTAAELDTLLTKLRAAGVSSISLLTQSTEGQ